jgi:CheY-like chemotaxis protein
VAAVIDIGLPEQTGDQLARRLREQFPALAILLTTGYDQHSFVRMFATDERINVLGKPFDGPDLLGALTALNVIAPRRD